MPSEEFLAKVLALLREVGGEADRRRLKDLAENSDIESPSERWPVDVCAGMALTVLHRRGEIHREGEGSRKSPFVYSIDETKLKTREPH